MAYVGQSSIRGVFYGLPLATLQTLLTDYTNCLIAIATAGQSYTISGRQFNRPQIEEVRSTIAELQAAINRLSGNSVTKTYARFTEP